MFSPLFFLGDKSMINAASTNSPFVNLKFVPEFSKYQEKVLQNYMSLQCLINTKILIEAIKVDLKMEWVEFSILRIEVCPNRNRM